jgi:hypothetical protein
MLLYGAIILILGGLTPFIYLLAIILVFASCMIYWHEKIEEARKMNALNSSEMIVGNAA